MTTESVKPNPENTRADRRAPAWLRIVLGGLLLLAPWVFIPLAPYTVGSAPNAVITLATFAAIFAVLAYAVGTLMRFLDLPSGGHAGLFGVGAYASGLAMTDLSLGFWPALLIAIAVASVVGLAMGALALRTSGLAFLIITIAIGELLVLILDNWESLTNGPVGLFLFDRPEILPGVSLEDGLGRYFVVLAFLAVIVGVVWLVAGSRFGERLVAIRDNEPLARSLGINTFGQKLLAFVLTAAIAGVAGHLYMIHLKAVTPDLFVAIGLITVFLMVVMGGQGTLAGPAVGAWFVTFLPEWFEPLGLDDPTRQEFVFGALLIAFMLLAPVGIMGGVSALVNRTVRRGTPLRSRVKLPLRAPQLSLPARTWPLGRRGGGVASDDADTFFRVTDIVKSFGAVKALDGVSFSVEPGEIVGVIGPNGSGKTTLLNCVSGMARAQGGSVIWKGEDIGRLQPNLVAGRGLVRTFQEAMSFPEYTPREHLELIWRPEGPSHIEGIDSQEDVLDLFGLRQVADTPAADLSYGHISALGVATAVASGLPEILMLDEPAAGLSNVESSLLRERLLDLRDRGLTVVVVDHDMPFLMPMCDRVIVLDAGKKIAEGTSKEVQKDPKVVAAYLGEHFAEGGEAASRRRRPKVAAAGQGVAPRADGKEHRDLVVDRLDAGYGNIQILSDVSLRVGGGEAVALLGANGAGKTTFLRAISGLLRPSDGSFSYGEEDLLGLDAPAILRRGIAHVPQGRQVFADQTVEENLQLGARLRRDRAAIAEDRDYILSVFPALGDKLKQAAGDLSGGQQQSLAIARALMSNPSLILLDEPSLGLAPTLIDDMAELLTRVREDRQTGMLLVEQDAMLALGLTDRTYVLRGGEIVMERASEDLIGDPSVVLAYLGGEESSDEPSADPSGPAGGRRGRR